MDQFLRSLSDSPKLEAKLRQLAQEVRSTGRTRLKDLLEKLQDYTDEDISIDRIPQVVTSLVDVSEEVAVRADEGPGIESKGNRLDAGRVIFQLIERLARDKREALLLSVFRVGKGVTLLGDLLIVIAQDAGEWGGQTRPDEERLVAPSSLHVLKTTWVERVKEVAERREVFALKDAAQAVVLWEKLESHSLKAWLAKAVMNDETLLAFLDSLVGHGFMHTAGDAVGTITLQFDPMVLDRFGLERGNVEKRLIEIARVRELSESQCFVLSRLADNVDPLDPDSSDDATAL
jgi:predicted KAP-like P-loop ATPase